jgi:hypothetical protein
MLRRVPEEPMSDESFFSRELDPVQDRNRWRLWFADVLELATAALLGWAGTRAVDAPPGTGPLLVGVGLAWVLVSAVGGLTGRTLWRHVLGVRLVTAQEGAPGLPRGLARAFTLAVDLPTGPVLQYRPMDRMMGLRAVLAPSGVGPWLRGFARQLPWLAALALAAWFIATPTRRETLTFLGTKLPGWHCCNGTRRAPKWQCETSLTRLLREARGGDAEALKVAADCPVATERLLAR